MMPVEIINIEKVCVFLSHLIISWNLSSSSDAGIYDRIVVQELIKTVAQSHQLESSTQREFKGMICNPF